MNGIIVVDKPSGMTSHDVVMRLRRRLGIKRIGHAGTLDPLAKGVLVMLVGQGTKLFSEFEGFDKAYRATLLLGTKTTTADIEGEIIQQASYEHVTRDQFQQVLANYRGPLEQLPPMVSAVKVNGKRLYKLARRGINVKRNPRRIYIHSLELVDFHPPQVKIFLECSKGTYVRKLAEDIGDDLKCGACIKEIQRTKVGPFESKMAVALDQVDRKHIQPWQP